MKLRSLLCVCLSRLLFAQEVAPPYYIKSIEFRSSENDAQFPIVSLGEHFYLQFDDIAHLETDYYYDIIHCDEDWRPSDLMKTYYLRGFDNLRISNYSNSYNTLVHYSHYELSIPNEDTSLKISGNYLIKIKNSNDIVTFTRRFVVYESLSKVGIETVRSRNLSKRNSEQVIHARITPVTPLDNPKQNISLRVLQNYDWNTEKLIPQPQYIQNTTLVYRYNDKMAFKGGNEFFYFDTKTINSKNVNTRDITRDTIYHHHLYSNQTQGYKPYTYYEDINGDFAIQNGDASNSNFEADYVNVSFELRGAAPSQTIYLYGNFSNYLTNKATQMHYDLNSRSYKATILLKQGIYNYKYISSEQGILHLYKLCGSFWQTENTYTALVYYRGYSDLYDRVIGVGRIRSTHLTN